MELLKRRMISEYQLQHMHQAWQQGNENSQLDWSYFVEYAAKQLNTSGDKIVQVLQRCHWFTMPKE